MRISIASGRQPAGPSRLLSLLPFVGAQSTLLRSRDQVRCISPRTRALRGRCRRTSDSRVDAQRVCARRKRMAAFRGGLGGDARTWSSGRRWRFGRGIEALSQHCVTSDKWQTTQGHIFACVLHALGDLGIQLPLQTLVVLAEKNSGSHESQRHVKGRCGLRVRR
jgi:hypothetical protein